MVLIKREYSDEDQYDDAQVMFDDPLDTNRVLADMHFPLDPDKRRKMLLWLRRNDTISLIRKAGKWPHPLGKNDFEALAADVPDSSHYDSVLPEIRENGKLIAMAFHYYLLTSFIGKINDQDPSTQNKFLDYGEVVYNKGKTVNDRPGSLVVTRDKLKNACNALWPSAHYWAATYEHDGAQYQYNPARRHAGWSRFVARAESFRDLGIENGIFRKLAHDKFDKSKILATDSDGPMELDIDLAVINQEIVAKYVSPQTTNRNNKKKPQ